MIKQFNILALVCILILMPVVLYAAPSVSFQWLQAPYSTWGTKVYIGTEPGVYSNTEDAGTGTTEYTIDNALEYSTTYYFTATHYDPLGGLESVYAEELVWTSPGPSAVVFNPLSKKKEHPIKSYILKFMFK